MANPKTLITPIPATWELPDDLAQAVAARDEALDVYADANDAHAQARADVQAAGAKDKAALRALARTGGKDPGADRHAQTAARALDVTKERERVTRQALITANRKVERLLITHWSTLARQTAATAREGTAEYLAEVTHLKQAHAHALSRWQASLEGFGALREAAQAAGGFQYQDSPQAVHNVGWNAPSNSARIAWFADEFDRRADDTARE